MSEVRFEMGQDTRAAISHEPVHDINRRTLRVVQRQKKGARNEGLR